MEVGNSIRYKRLKDLLPILVNRETGIIKDLLELPRQADMPNLIYYKAVIGNSGIFGLPDNFPVSGGTSTDRDKALAKAVGEAIERYCSSVYFPDEMIFGSYRELMPKALSPGLFEVFTQQQYRSKGFPCQPFTDDSRINWYSGTNMKTGSEVLLPASLVYCPYTIDRKSGEALISENISTGLAAHCSYEEAAINAILEVVERDSFMLHWLASRSPAKIDLQSLGPAHRDLLDRFRKYGYEITLLNTTPATGIPTVIGVMRGRYSGTVPFLVAASTHLDPSEAITKCLEEFALIERYAKRVMLTADQWDPGDDFELVNQLMDHVRLWLDPEVIPAADFLTASGGSVRLDALKAIGGIDPGESLADLLDRIHQEGYEVYMADVTTEDIRPLGLYVLRAVIPGYIPLNKSYQCRPLGNKRLLAYLQQQDIDPKINPYPHPFA